jgi:hypothetical protein
LVYPFAFSHLKIPPAQGILDTLGAIHLVAISVIFASLVALDNCGFFTNVVFIDQSSNAGFPSIASLKLSAGSGLVSFAVIAGSLFFGTWRLAHLSKESSTTTGHVLFDTVI